MQKSLKDSGKRRSLFARTPLSGLTPTSEPNPSNASSMLPNTLKKRRTSSQSTSELSWSSFADIGRDGLAPESSTKQGTSSSRGSSGRPTSLFGSLRSTRTWDDVEEPLSATSVKSPVNPFTQPDSGTRWSKNVLFYSEVQTSSSMFRKKKEFLVLTETHIVRTKNQQKASEMFSGVASSLPRLPNVRHTSYPSGGSGQDHHSNQSENSGDHEAGTPLKQIIATYLLDDGRPYFAIEIAMMDDACNTHTLTLQLSTPSDRDKWLMMIRAAANKARLADTNPISQRSSEFAARIVERERDYDPENYTIFRVLQRQSAKLGARASAEDVTKENPTACFLVIGIHKVHLIPVSRQSRTSSPSLGTYNAQENFGILSLTYLRLNDLDDCFELTFRLPLERPRTLCLASLASHEIAVKLRQVDDFLRPEWETRPYTYVVPEDVKSEIISTPTTGPLDQDSLDRTLIAYSIAYGVDPGNIRYQVTYPPEDGPEFELLKPVESRRPQYTALELLAIMRALRYNESFGALSFSGISLDALNGLNDTHGQEHVCFKTKRGTPVGLHPRQLSKANLLTQEVRALAVSNRKLRRMNFTSCVTRSLPDAQVGSRNSDSGCSIVEALFPLCEVQSTNVDWVELNGIQLSDTDLDYIVSGAVKRSCHFRALGLSRCGLTDRSLSFILDTLRAQDNTLEAIDISGNPARLSPSTFGAQISIFGFIRKLNLSHVSRTSGPEPLLSAETLMIWRLQELNLSGTPVNTNTVEALACYLHSPQSETLHELHLEHTYINGRDMAVLMKSMTETPGKARDLHLNISQNLMESDHKHFSNAIAQGYAPSHLTVRMMEYEDEGHFRDLVLAIAANNTIKFLNMAQASLPCDASDATCLALEKMFSDNHSLEILDISGEDSRLETNKLGVGINRALCGLKNNDTLRVLYVQHQKLGMRGAGTLADVLKANTTLRELHCENNGIMLSGFTDLINALHRNTTLTYLPTMNESRELALHETEQSVRSLRDEQSQAPSRDSNRKFSRFLSAPTSKLARSVTPSGNITDGTRGRNQNHHNGPSPLSDADIRAAMSLVDESWGRQLYRLSQYLGRNYNIANGIPTNLDVADEAFERPDSGSSLSKIIERVAIDSTPTSELDEPTYVIYGDGDSKNLEIGSKNPSTIPSVESRPSEVSSVGLPGGVDERIPPSPVRSPPAFEL